ncbi:hypothetical protein PC116_g34803, partial [Phytophthora cactorum]
MTVVAGTISTTHRFGSGPSEKGQELSEKEFGSTLSKATQEILLKSISLNSTAFEGEVDGVKTFIGSKTETALLEYAKAYLGMGPVSEERSNAKIIQAIPFDSGRKCMGVVVQLENGGARLYVK